MSVILACPKKCTCNKKTVTCEKKNLEAFPVNIPKDTVHLSLRENKILKIPQNGILNDLIYLESLDLSRNQLQYIPKKSFLHLKKLKTLKLGENNIKKITAKNFYGLERLENLGLEINDMTNISRNNFKYLKNLKTIDISANYYTEIPPNAFTMMEDLEELNVFQNLFKIIRKDAFGYMPRLTWLDLSENEIGKIEPGTFNQLPNLDLLALNDELTTIEKDTLQNFKQLNYLFMNNRRLNCTCDLIKQLNVLKDINIDTEIDGWCTHPKYLKDREIRWIDNAEIKNC